MLVVQDQVRVKPDFVEAFRQATIMNARQSVQPGQRGRRGWPRILNLSLKRPTSTAKEFQTVLE